jgi:hypothetical protein
LTLLLGVTSVTTPSARPAPAQTAHGHTNVASEPSEHSEVAGAHSLAHAPETLDSIPRFLWAAFCSARATSIAFTAAVACWNEALLLPAVARPAAMPREAGGCPLIIQTFLPLPPPPPRPVLGRQRAGPL